MKYIKEGVANDRQRAAAETERTQRRSDHHRRKAGSPTPSQHFEVCGRLVCGSVLIAFVEAAVVAAIALAAANIETHTPADWPSISGDEATAGLIAGGIPIPLIVLAAMALVPANSSARQSRFKAGAILIAVVGLASIAYAAQGGFDGALALGFIPSSAIATTVAMVAVPAQAMRRQ